MERRGEVEKKIRGEREKLREENGKGMRDVGRGAGGSGVERNAEKYM